MTKMVSVFNRLGDEIRVTPDMVEFYDSIGWKEKVVKAKKVAAPVEPEITEESE